MLNSKLLLSTLLQFLLFIVIYIVKAYDYIFVYREIDNLKYYHQADAELAPILMSCRTLKDASCLDAILGLKLTPKHKWNEYIYVITNNAERMVCSL